ncbi:unnamed protein product, partial [Pocillopora meandrina]
MDYSRAKSPNIGNVLNARRLARRKLQRSAIREREKQEIEKKNPLFSRCLSNLNPKRLNETKKYNHIQLVAHCESIHTVINMEYHRNYKRSKKATGILKKRLVPVPAPTPEIVVKKELESLRVLP